MIIDANSVKVGSTYMAQYITEAKFGYHKLWGQDSGRNLAGVQSGTLLGIFPKITLQFRRLTKSELEVVAPILDSASQSVTYYDPKNKANTTMTTYTGDWELVNKALLQNEGFSCAFISTSPRT